MGRADARRAAQGRKRRAKPKGEKGGIRRFFTWKKVLGAVLGVCLLGILGFLGLYLYVDVPDEGNFQATSQSNVYKYADGSVVARKGADKAVNREIVKIDQIPKHVQHAFVAAENKTFYQDSGVDLKGTLRGILNTLAGKGKQGGSTITQQYVKNYYLSQEQTVSRKLQEIVISLKVDNKLGKDEILAGYMNTSYYGRGAYGIQAAAQAYYGVDVDKLTVSQGAYLASLLQAPSQYDWAIASDAGKKRVQERWAYTLDNMVEMKWLDAADRQKQTFQQPIKPKPLPGVAGQVGYFIKAADDELIRRGVDEKELAAGGWTITLAIDKKKQQELEKAVKTKLTDDLKPSLRKADRDAQLGAVSVDPATGHVVAMYGGAGYTKHYTNNATRADFQPASTFKPLIFASALENHAKTQSGLPITPDTVYDGRNRRPVVNSIKPFAPPNEDEQQYGHISVQQATNNSVNSVFAQMGADVGLDAVKKTAVSLGMDGSRMDVQPAMTLGSMGASPLQMAAVYATLDNHGKKVEPALVAKAQHGAQDVELTDPIGSQVLTRGTADTVTSVLRGVVNDGTANKAIGGADYQAAGKTGTSDDNKSAWFVGYTPKLVTAVGMFGEEAKGGKQVSLKGTGGGGRVNGGGYPAEVWAAYTAAAIGDDSGAKFDLETDLGAGVAPTNAPPPSNTPSHSPSQTPSQTPSHSPSQTPSHTPSHSPSHSPSRTPSRTPSPPETPPATPTDGSGGSGGNGNNRPPGLDDLD
ncbi:transglycosylase domain-containing protein [Streptomyces paromomycinus]|uniref:Penicillin-binding protein n=1 Tax=Streptomyces paromomycinus TaxID=92743 RepID=A0A401W1X1_STREY|nr:transglycosylase domain-containing protein [Streptomyces paromomycinus]GCD43319.1 penicillin-binding protein [Streptomyces paromomycinus]